MTIKNAEYKKALADVMDAAEFFFLLQDNSDGIPEAILDAAFETVMNLDKIAKAMEAA